VAFVVERPSQRRIIAAARPAKGVSISHFNRRWGRRRFHPQIESPNSDAGGNMMPKRGPSLSTYGSSRGGGQGFLSLLGKSFPLQSFGVADAAKRPRVSKFFPMNLPPAKKPMEAESGGEPSRRGIAANPSAKNPDSRPHLNYRGRGGNEAETHKIAAGVGFRFSRPIADASLAFGTGGSVRGTQNAPLLQHFFPPSRPIPSTSPGNVFCSPTESLSLT